MQTQPPITVSIYAADPNITVSIYATSVSQVRKWANVPEPVMNLLATLRGKTQAYQDMFSIVMAFPKKPSADKAKKVLESMASEGLRTPAVAHAIYFRLAVEDCAHFFSVPDLTNLFHPDDGYLKDVSCEKDEVQELIKESLGTVLQGWVANIVIKDGNVNDDSKDLGRGDRSSCCSVWSPAVQKH